MSAISSPESSKLFVMYAYVSPLSSRYFTLRISSGYSALIISPTQTRSSDRIRPEGLACSPDTTNNVGAFGLVTKKIPCFWSLYHQLKSRYHRSKTKTLPCGMARLIFLACVISATLPAVTLTTSGISVCLLRRRCILIAPLACRYLAPSHSWRHNLIVVESSEYKGLSKEKLLLGVISRHCSISKRY